MSINKSQHSLAMLKGIEAIIDAFASLELKHDEVVQEVTTDPNRKDNDRVLKAAFEPITITFWPKNEELDFWFELRGVKDNASRIDYLISFKPQSATTTGEYFGSGTLSTTIARFENWAELIKDYNTVRLSKKERFVHESAQQYYAEFKLVDEDADTAPFDNSKQVFVYKFLDYIKEKVEQVEDGDKEQAASIIKDIKLLQESISASTKATVVKGLSKIFAKVQVFSIKLLVDFFDVAKKEALKGALYGGLGEMNDIMHHLHIL